MSWKSIVAGTSSELLHRLGDGFEALVRHLGDGDVRLDRRERVVADLRATRVSALKRVDLPAFGSPTIPTFIAPPAAAVRLRLRRGLRQRHRAPSASPSTHPDRHVGGVVHPQVGTTRRRSPTAGTKATVARRSIRVIASGDGEGGGRVGRGEAQRARRAAQRRQALEHRARSFDDELDAVVEADRGRAERGAGGPGASGAACRRRPGRRWRGTSRCRCCRPCRAAGRRARSRARARGSASPGGSSGRGHASAAEDSRQPSSHRGRLRTTPSSQGAVAVRCPT